MTTINNQDDFLRALRNNPEWRDAVRSQILGDELLQLPVRFDAFVRDQQQFNKRIENDIAELKTDMVQVKEDIAELKTDMVQVKEDIAELKTDMVQVKEDIAELKTDVAELKTDVAELKTDMNQVKEDIAELKTDMNQVKTDLRSQTGRIDNALGANYQSKVERNLPSIAGQHLQLRRTTALRSSQPNHDAELADIIERAVDDARITEAEGDEIWLLDLIFTGHDQATGSLTYVAAETSITAGDDDITRAASRAQMLASAIGQPVTAAVISAHIDDARLALAASQSVTPVSHPEA